MATSTSLRLPLLSAHTPNHASKPASLSLPCPSSRRRRGCLHAAAAFKELSETGAIPMPQEPGEFLAWEVIPPKGGVYAVYDAAGKLQYLGISGNVAAIVADHRKEMPKLCRSVKVWLAEEDAPDSVLTDAWKSWMEEHLLATGKPPPGNFGGNRTWEPSDPVMTDGAPPRAFVVKVGRSAARFF